MAFLHETNLKHSSVRSQNSEDTAPICQVEWAHWSYEAGFASLPFYVAAVPFFFPPLLARRRRRRSSPLASRRRRRRRPRNKGRGRHRGLGTGFTQPPIKGPEIIKLIGKTEVGVLNRNLLRNIVTRDTALRPSLGLAVTRIRDKNHALLCLAF